ncbi:MAG: nitroreductase family protein [Thermomicrobiales bacterium]
MRTGPVVVAAYRARAVTSDHMAIQTLGACAQNMLLMAYRLGLDMGGMWVPHFCPEVARDMLGLPHDHVPHALLQLGHAAADPKRRARRRLDELITPCE